MEFLRTPDDRFASLPGWSFAPNYAEIDDTEGGALRVHWVDEGPRDADPVLLMHGEPTWGYLYRTMIPVLVAAGHRVVVPDLVGFGRSDKPTRMSDHTYGRHVRWMNELIIDRLDLRGATFFGQDWGGMIGLRVVAANPDRFDRVVVANTGLPRGDGRIGEAFLAWRKFSQESPTFDVGRIVARACATAPSPDVVAAYDAPFPDDTYKAGARIMPSLVPVDEDSPEAAENRAAWEVLRTFDKPWLCTFSDLDPVTRGGDKAFISDVPGTRGQPHRMIENAGHFLQEDKGPEIAGILADFIASTPR